MELLAEVTPELANANATKAMELLVLSVRRTNQSLNAFFLITMALVVYFMQCGFAFLEAGAVRSKHTTNILIKNMLDSFIGCIAYYTFGWGLTNGEPGNAFCGNSGWAMNNLADSKLPQWFFQFVFAATSATIVSGALAERCEFVAYMSYSFIITGFVYPIVAHWVWNPIGWLRLGLTAQNGTLASSFHDFAGSGVVHITGGTAALVAAALLGPRIGRFDPDTRAPMSMPGHSVPLISFGGFVLFFGFLAFNGGSRVSITKAGDGAVVAAAMVNTVLSASIGAFASLILNRIRSPYWSLLRTLNGGFAGMVAICAGGDVVYPWAACIIGLFAAASYVAWSELVLKLKVDDPVDAVAVHLGGGLWGVIAVAFLHSGRGIVFRWNAQSGLDLAMQLVGASAIIAWSGSAAALIFGSLRLLNVLRVPMEIEIKGVDYPKHGEMAYPLTSYGHGWIEESGAVPEIGITEIAPAMDTAAASSQGFEEGHAMDVQTNEGAISMETVNESVSTRM